ncbi:hypothetical protein [Roseimicrobium sp. ORNL1]|uniref:hypothetical protein n=1 Tax=Roseimicrobium sp. ORNL1 TaxID=2711231 RepID=UPI0013E1FAAA|nr:hypothetical protein [Roseimicrobium sp. ORNL1]QIF00832.1 hypothetical protein G5S37_04595 [Roseimicrobium sp. ORNL1]
MHPPALASASPPDRDAEHLRLLALFHFIKGGLDLLMVGAITVQYAFMNSIFTRMKFTPGFKKNPPPEFFFDFFIWIILFFGLVHLVSVVLNVMVGFYLEKLRHRTFSMVVAGLNCLHMPIGTALGIFTLIVLNRDSVRAKFAAAEGTLAPPR